MQGSSAYYPGTQDMYIGKPIQNVAGPFEGRTIRSQLEEYQKPDLGRKFARRDRRPVDPPPVVQLRMFEVIDAGKPSEREEELHAESIETTGLVAHVDLFAVKPPSRMGQDHLEGLHTPGSATAPQSGHNWQLQPQTSGSSYPDALREEHFVDIDEDSALTSAVFGSSFVHAVKVQDIAGDTVILFVFADLSVKIEGHFVYRYRCFNLFSRVAGSDDVPITAELYSGVFVIYSTKEFPGLQASTAITKHLGRWGVRVNLRETSRGKKNKHDGDDDDDGVSSGGGETAVDEERGVQFYTRNFLAPLAGTPSIVNQTPQVLFGPPTGYQPSQEGPSD